MLLALSTAKDFLASLLYEYNLGLRGGTENTISAGSLLLVRTRVGQISRRTCVFVSPAQVSRMGNSCVFYSLL
jgi:hypothetical protein